MSSTRWICRNLRCATVPGVNSGVAHASISAQNNDAFKNAAMIERHAVLTREFLLRESHASNRHAMINNQDSTIRITHTKD